MAGPNEYIHISFNNIAAHRDLLIRAYNDIYAPVYPPDKGGDPLEEWLDRLEHPDGENDVRIVIAGKDLTQPGAAPVFKAMTMSVYYSGSDTGVLSFIITDKKFRNEGLGKRMTFMQADFLRAAAQEHGNDLRGWYIECHDPAKTDKNYDGYDSKKLVNKYLSWGAREIPVDYTIPADTGSRKKVGYYMLLSAPHPVTGAHPNYETTLNHIRSVYRDYSIRDPDSDSAFLAMKRQMENDDVRRPRPPSQVQPQPPLS